MTKICSKCKQVKDLSEFYKDKNKKNGLRSQCKACVKEYRKANKESIAKLNKKYYQINKESIAKKQKIYNATKAGKEVQKRNDTNKRIKFPNKIKATNAVNHAIRSGKLIRPTSCSLCGKTNCQIEGHHHSYAEENWLNVIWLCSQCHKELHKNLKQNI